jgi:diphthine-ammonia ligase
MLARFSFRLDNHLRFSFTICFLLQNLRFYFPTSLGVPVEALSLMLTNAFNELAEMGQRVKIGEEPIFNLVPVLSAGRSATSMDNIITCELFAQKA